MFDNKIGWVAIVAIASVVAACGGDDGDDTDKQAGTSGTGGAAAGANAAGSGGASHIGGNAGMSGAGGAAGMAGSGSGGATTASGGTGASGAGGSGAGGSGSGGTMAGPPGTSPSPTDPPDISTCPQPAATATDAAKVAFTAVNTLRLATGAGCAVMVEELSKSSTNHCVYYAANAADDMCTADPHGEVESCMEFTGASPGARMKAAGYMGNGGGSEVMAFSNNAQSAINQWINSVWHRIPILDPWTAEFGYGAAEGCDVMDLGRGTPAPDSTVTVYPYDNQIDVPLEFDGSREGPMPPAPPTGWPSGSPINVYAKMLTVTEHTLTKDGDATPIEHVWLTAAESNFLRNGVMMYPNAPFAAMTKYRVKVVGTRAGTPVNLEWTFTTGKARTGFPRP